MNRNENFFAKAILLGGVVLMSSTGATAQMLSAMYPELAESQKDAVRQMLAEHSPRGGGAMRFAKNAAATDEAEDAPQGCLVPFQAFTEDADEIDDLGSLDPLPFDAADPALACEAEIDGPAGAAFAKAPSTVKGWRVDASKLREFRDVSGKLLFQVAPATRSGGILGVYIGRGASKTVNGKATIYWARRVVTNVSLVEFQPRLQTKSFVGEITDFVKDPLSYLRDKLNEGLKWIRKNLPKWVSKGIEKMAKQLTKWALELLTDLIGKPGDASPMVPTFVGQMGQTGASENSLNEYLATIDTVRAQDEVTMSDKVFLSIAAPVTRTGDVAAGVALAKTIDTLK